MTGFAFIKVCVQEKSRKTVFLYIPARLIRRKPAVRIYLIIRRKLAVIVYINDEGV